MRIWKLPSFDSLGKVGSLPLPSKPAMPEKRFYSLFRKIDGRWNRISVHAYSDGRIAGMVFGAIVCASPLEYSIRPCVIELNSANLRFGR